MGSEHIAHIRVIQVLPVADNWIDEDEGTQAVCYVFLRDPTNSVRVSRDYILRKIEWRGGKVTQVRIFSFSYGFKVRINKKNRYFVFLFNFVTFIIRSIKKALHCFLTLNPTSRFLVINVVKPISGTFFHFIL